MIRIAIEAISAATGFESRHVYRDTISIQRYNIFIMKYKPTYGDKQREAARRKKNERQQIRQTEPDTAKQEVAGQPKGGEKRSEREDKSAA